MSYKIAICDDDNTQNKYLKTLLSTWTAENGISATVSAFSSAESLLFDGAFKYDILLLDIEMSGMSGIELAKKIREHNEASVIIFVTGYSDYIAEGYDVQALHYLIKPIDRVKLFSVLDKAVKLIAKNERTITIEHSGETFCVPLREIRYLEVSGNYVTIHAKTALTVKKTLGEIAKLLDDRFARTGRSFIVNLTYVRRITKTDVFLDGGDVIPLSRGMYDPLNRALIERT